MLALVRYTMGPDKGKKGGHFIVFDAWRDLLIIGHVVMPLRGTSKHASNSTSPSRGHVPLSDTDTDRYLYLYPLSAVYLGALRCGSCRRTLTFEHPP